MTKVGEIAHTIKDITDRYSLKLLELDLTDVTLIARIGFSREIFMQIYANEKKEKLNMALVVAGERVYKKAVFIMNIHLKILYSTLKQNQ
jgi:hypothetical protein